MYSLHKAPAGFECPRSLCYNNKEPKNQRTGAGKKMILSTLCYIKKDGCWLMLHRVKKKNDLNHDKWIGVGGKFEEGESPEDCLLREVGEETGLTLTDYRFRGLVTFVSDEAPTEYMHLFTATGFTGTLRDCDEGTLEWVPIPQVETLPLWQGDKLFLRLLQTEKDFFSLKLRYAGDQLVQAVRDGRPLPPEED